MRRKKTKKKEKKKELGTCEKIGGMHQFDWLNDANIKIMFPSVCHGMTKKKESCDLASFLIRREITKRNEINFGEGLPRISREHGETIQTVRSQIQTAHGFVLKFEEPLTMGSYSCLKIYKYIKDADNTEKKYYTEFCRRKCDGMPSSCSDRHRNFETLFE